VNQSGVLDGKRAGTVMGNLIHFLERDHALPLCGLWGEDTSWTTSPNVVVCPGCLAALRRRVEAEIGPPTQKSRSDRKG
jgi:hypothetical protein